MIVSRKQFIASMSQLFKRREDSFLTLINSKGGSFDIEKSNLNYLCSEKEITVVFSEASPTKKQKLDTGIETSFTKADKLVRLFKNVQDGKVKLEDEVVEVKPDLPFIDIPGALGQADLKNVIHFEQTYCLNESPENDWQNAFTDNDAYLESDVDEELLLNVRFTETVNLHSILLRAPITKESHAPKTIRFFANEMNIDFDRAESLKPTQTCTLNFSHYQEKKLIILDLFKWQNVHSITICVVDTLGDEDTSIILGITILGKPSKRPKF